MEFDGTLPTAEPRQITARIESSCARNRKHHVSIGDRLTFLPGIGWVCSECAS